MNAPTAIPSPPARTATTAACRHCGRPFRTSARETEFCCSGCRFVCHLLHKRGLEDFYRYGEGRVPVADAVFQEREWSWLRELQQAAERKAASGASSAELTLAIQGISCAGCVWLLEAVFLEQPGAVSCRVDSSAGTISLRWQSGATDLREYATDAGRFGYVLGPPSDRTGPPVMRPLVRKLGICGALAMNAMLFAMPRYLGMDPGDRLAALFDLIGLLIATASIAIGGTYFFRRAWAALRRGDLHIDLPISLGLLFAYGGSVLAWRAGEHSFAYFDFVSVFTFLMLVGRWLQERSVENNRRRLLGIRLSPGRVHILRNGIESVEDATRIAAGDRFSLPRAGLVPVRARLVGQPGIFAMNWINGEPAPRQYPSGAIVPAGARSLSPEPLSFTALEPWASSQLARLLSFDTARPWRNLGLQKVIRIYLTCVLVLAALGFVAWAASGAGWLAAFQVLISVLVVSCPCAIGVALPLLDDISAARLQQFGVYLREHSLWSRLLRVQSILFDKTGTITLENLALANPEALESLDDHTRAVLLALVQDSLHPVAGCLRQALLAAGVEPAAGAGAKREITGMGIEWQTQHGRWRIGRASWAVAASAADGTVLSRNGKEVARFTFREELRPDAAAQIAAFRAAGYAIHLLSGDEPAKVAALAGALGLDQSSGLGGLSPEDKARLVRERWADASLLLGDGANDSLAFDAALCTGTPAADTGLLEHKADFYLLGRSLAGLGELFGSALRHRRATIGVFSFAISYNALAVSASLAGWMNPLVAAIIMPLSSLASIALVFFLLRKSQNSPHSNQPPCKQ